MPERRASFAIAKSVRAAWHIDNIGDYDGTMEDAMNEYTICVGHKGILLIRIELMV